MKKRLARWLLCACLLLGCMGSAFAKDAPCIYAGNVYGSAGSTVEVPVFLSGCGGFADLAIEIGYDADAMTLVGVADRTPEGALCVTSQYFSANPYSLHWMSAENVRYNGVLAILTFRLGADASGEYAVTVSAYRGRNGDFQDGVDVNYDEKFQPLGLQYEGGVVEAGAESARTVRVCVGERQVELAAAHPLCGEILIAVYQSSGQLAAVYVRPAAESVLLPEHLDGETAAVFWLDRGLPVCPMKTVDLL